MTFLVHMREGCYYIIDILAFNLGLHRNFMAQWQSQNVVLDTELQPDKVDRVTFLPLLFDCHFHVSLVIHADLECARFGLKRCEIISKLIP